MRLWSLPQLFLLVLTGCGGCNGSDDKTGTDSVDGVGTDGDGDGYGDDDCDDEDAEINPGADEICDGVDNDCDGMIDDGDPGVEESSQHTWYQDADYDTFGDDESTAVACDPPWTNGVLEGGDCDDGDEEVYPGAIEICNDKDDDCDGTVDIGATDGDDVWADTDGDGYGDPEAGTTLCEVVDGYADNDGDCDDGDENINPDADEICFNAIDEDCDDQADESCPVDLCAEISGDITEDYTIAVNDNGYYVDCDINVGGTDDPVLTIEGGTQIYFGLDVRFDVGTDAPGSLVIDGNDDPVFIGSGKAYVFPTLSPEPGDWVGLTLGEYFNTDLSSIKGLNLWYGGGIDAEAAITIDAVSPEIDDSEISLSGSAGVAALNGAWPQITDTTFSENTDHGFYADDDSGPVGFSGNMFSENLIFPVSILASTVGGLEATNEYADHDSEWAYVELRGATLTDSTTVYAQGYPYYVNGTLTLSASETPTLTLTEGTQMAFAYGSGLVTGNLTVEGGTTGVLLTAYETDKGWDGVTVEKGDYDVTLTGLTVSYGGGGSFGANLAFENGSLGLEASVSDSVFNHSLQYGIYVGPSAEPEISGTSISDNTSVGLYIYDGGTSEGGLDSSGSTASFVDNVLDGNASPMQVPASYLAQLDSSSSYDGNSSDYVTVTGSTVDSTGTWQTLNVPYWVDGDIAISGASTPGITIESGAIFYVDEGNEVTVGSSSAGSLSTAGTADAPVTFTSALSPPAPGDWKGITFGSKTYGSGSSLAGLVVSYAGGGSGTTASNVYIDDASDPPSFSACTLSNSAGAGMYIYGSTTKPAPDITNCTFEDNDGNGLTLGTNGRLGTFTGVTMDSNGDYPISVPAAVVDSLDADADYGDNGIDAVEVSGGNIDDDSTWQDLPVPYLVTDDIYIRSLATMEVSRGTTVAFDDAKLNVGYVTNGALYAVGTSSQPITFTSWSGDSGSWDGVYFLAKCSDSELRYVTISDANYNGRFECNSDIVIQNTTFEDAADYDIYCTTAAKHLVWSDVTYTTNSGCTVD